MQIDFEVADYSDPQQAETVLALLNAYACDPMGGGEPLRREVRDTLIEKLAVNPAAFSVIGYLKDDNGKQPVALANCFLGFSTFKAKPLINIHDCYVDSNLRGQHIAQKLLAKIEEIATQKDCCKITLEVLEGNKQAQAAYQKYGFSAYSLDPASGNALFWEKPIN